MTWTYVLRPREIEGFIRCRRQWDLSASVRQGYRPSLPPPFEFDKAVYCALAAYYLPAMDEWDRAIVRPLALRGFLRSMGEDRAAHEAVQPFTAEVERDFADHIALGETVLGHYLDWAMQVDDFASVFADHALWAHIADPDAPGNELGTPDRRPVRYFARLDQLFSDDDDQWWAVEHRVVPDRWSDEEELLGPSVALWNMWALEVSYPQLRLAGTVLNELRLDACAAAPRHDHGIGRPDIEVLDKRDMTGKRHPNYRRSPLTVGGDDCAPVVHDDSRSPAQDEILLQQGNEFVRRTYVGRSRRSISDVGRYMGRLAAEMVTAVRTPPDPAPQRCAACAYVAPCDAMNAGADPGPLLQRRFRRRPPDEFPEEQLRWSPARQRARSDLGDVGSGPATVRSN